LQHLWAHTQTPLDAQFRLLQQPMIPRAILCVKHIIVRQACNLLWAQKLLCRRHCRKHNTFNPEVRLVRVGLQCTHCGFSCPYKRVYFRAPEHRRRPRAAVILKQG
jgi:hypothetical protein